MEQFDFRKKTNQRLQELEMLIKYGITIGIDLNLFLKKIESIKKTLNDGVIRIVLLGEVSNGKTSAVAGLLGRLEDSMKIDVDESTDELVVYRPDGLKEGFEIVDTPGLFGSKEKQVDGENIKFSEITKRYISEAHIVIFVCGAVTPLKDSHTEIIKKILRDYKKLNSTIFVINRMDETGCDLLDEEDYVEMKKIKEDNLISRLRSTINITPDEERNLKIACIAANPKEKGLEYWFARQDEYLKRSHINTFRSCLNSVVEESDKRKLQSSASDVSTHDVVDKICNIVEEGKEPIKKELDKIKEQLQDLAFDESQMKKELKSNKDEMSSELNQLKSQLVMHIRSASSETIAQIIDSEIGIQDGKVNFYIFHNNVRSILTKCGDANTETLQDSAIHFEKVFNMQENMLRDAVKNGSKFLKEVNITGEQVKAARDFISQYFGKTYKFKPYGAVNLGKDLTKWAGWIGVGISAGFELYDWYKSYKEAKELLELKNKLCNALNDEIAHIFDSFKDDTTYFKNYAPIYIDLRNRLKVREQEIEKLQQTVSNLEAYNSRLRKWLTADATYVEFEELNS